MALFLSSNIYQGDERFSVHSGGKQCAFTTLSAILKAQNRPLTEWSKKLFNNVLIQGDKMYLHAVHSGLLILDKGVVVLSVNYLPSVVRVSCCGDMWNDFSYEICRPLIDRAISTSPSLVTNNDLPIEAPNTIELPTEAHNTIELPTEAHNTIEMLFEAH